MCCIHGNRWYALQAIKASANKRSDAALKGWVTRRANLARLPGIPDEEVTPFVINQPTKVEAPVQESSYVLAR